MRTVVILAYGGCQLLDVAGPTSVFTEAAAFADPAPYRVVLASSAGGLVMAEGSIGLATIPLAEVPAEIDTLLLPGAGRAGLRGLLRDGPVREWVVAATARARRVASVCTGAFALAAWGLLDGRRAATHWLATADLARRFPAVRVDEQALFVEDGPVWTSAGVSTGIDMALALVERDLGRGVASGIARRLVLQMRRPGHQSQFSALLDAQGGSYATLVAWMTDNLSGDLGVEALAARAGQAPRTFHRRFSAEVGLTPAAFVERLRLDHARALLEAGQPPKRVAVTAGFGSQDRLARAFKRAFALSPSAYRALHGQGGEAGPSSLAP